MNTELAKTQITFNRLPISSISAPTDVDQNLDTVPGLEAAVLESSSQSYLVTASDCFGAAGLDFEGTASREISPVPGPKGRRPRRTVAEQKAAAAEATAKYASRHRGETKAIVVSLPDFFRLEAGPAPLRDGRKSRAKLVLEAFVMDPVFPQVVARLTNPPRARRYFAADGGGSKSGFWGIATVLAKKHRIQITREFVDDLTDEIILRKRESSFEFQNIKNDRSRTRQLVLSRAAFDTLKRVVERVDAMGGKGFSPKQRPPSFAEIVGWLIRSEDFKSWEKRRRSHLEIENKSVFPEKTSAFG